MLLMLLKVMALHQMYLSPRKQDICRKTRESSLNRATHKKV